jgi:hypothetical protein
MKNLKGFKAAARILSLVAAGLVLFMSLPTKSTGFPASPSEALPGEHDLQGIWRIEATRSEDPPIEFVDAVRAETEGGGPGGGVWFLPHVFRIGTSDNGLALSDSTGTILQVIMFMKVSDGDGGRMPPRFTGTWKKDHLTVVRPGRKGTTLKQTFSLQDKETRLVVKTKMQRDGASDFEVKRVYTRVAAS